MHPPLAQIIDRGNDPTGFGHFGAKRGFYKNGKRRYHKGYDIVSKIGEDVVSMIDGVVTKIGYAYAKALQFRYVEVTNDTFRVRLMYIEHDYVKVGQKVCSGDRVGYCLGIANYHNRNKKKGQLLMINHLHIQIWKNGKLIDPKQYL
ncbi:M23 family metallopeptidase [Lutibacter sp. Hel_I_33_5]|uniref:M23 family metallopeptidase n=1 Tax=Lutibacter sp. Hel_I_33_5 TaxID=1566289 RepID=UPI001645F816|nr:M23 family metallopeptidase [Lutibacter sp. Hel_I_33_5]